MSNHRPESPSVNPDYPGLTKTTVTLPTDWYLDQRHFEHELNHIWYTHWVSLCRAEDLPSPGDYKTFMIGSQGIIVLRDEQGVLRAFHNTCRHRGSILLTEASGQLDKATRILCPYHCWAYSSQGELLRTGRGSTPDDFIASDYSLYSIAIEEWRGFVYANLDPDVATGVSEAFDEYSVSLDNWPLEELRRGYQYEKVLNCNWKLFWENFNECLHCPNVHPDLCRVVPIYKRGFMEAFDDPQWQAGRSDEPQYAGGLAEGAETWSSDGRSTGHTFELLSAAERQAGHNYAMLMPSMFIVAHVDHVRTVQLLPLSPTSTALRADWYFPQAALQDDAVDVKQFATFARQVIDEDGRAAELNQRGLANKAHKQGVLMAEEYDVHRFQQWVRNCLQ